MMHHIVAMTQAIPIENPHDPSTWPTGRALLLEPLVRRVLAPNASPYTFTGTQTYLVGAGADLAVIDPGPAGTGASGHADTRGAGHVEAIVDAIGAAKVTAIVCTHTHRDHSPASRALQAATGAPIIGCAALTLDDEGPRADAAFDPDYRPDRVLTHGERLSGEGWTIEAVATPGHTSNHLCYALIESGALFTGDHVMGWSTTVVSPPDGDMAAYLDSLALLQTRQDRVYYPAHGPQIDNPRQFVRGTIGHRRQRERQIVSHLEAGPRTIPDLVATMYKGIDPRLYGAAGRSVLAHLIDLQRQARVVAEGERWLALPHPAA
jgi:glyoxylase-like metal-dependent hydrolase (beta-lactamase superfamily II)